MYCSTGTEYFTLDFFTFTLNPLSTVLYCTNSSVLYSTHTF